jgi:hypothetical protein
MTDSRIVERFQMNEKSNKSRSTSGSTESAVTPVADRILKRRRMGLLRSALIIVIAGCGLIFFTSWYRSWPQDLDCQRMNQRIAVAMENYRRVHQKLPQILKILDVRTGRYSLDHYEYWFEGLGGPKALPEGTVIAYCKAPHEPIFSDSWRSVIIFMNGSIVVGRMKESEFQAKIVKQLSPENYWSTHKSF